MESDQLRHNRLHILFLPLMLFGHLIPMVEIVKLIAQRGVRCTVVTTGTYADVVRSAIKNTPTADLHLVSLPTPIDPKTGGFAFLFSLRQLLPSIEAILRDLSPTAVVADMFFPWVTTLCAELGIPRLLFCGHNTFTRCLMASFYAHSLDEVTVAGDGSADEKVVSFHDLPHRIQMLKTQFPGPDSLPPQMATLLNEMREAEEGCYGEVINSFYDLEPDYVRYNSEVLGGRAWLVGPVSLCNHDARDLSTRGAAEDSPISRRCQEWLDSKPITSVLYICFGSLMPVSVAQIQEISLALESAQHPFLWVVRETSADETSQPWSEAIKHKEDVGECLIIRGWAPQLLILNHASTVGFVTHCGWNSCLESIAAGVPMATWPLFADQFFNERLLCDVLQVGVPVGSKHYSFEEDRRPVIAATDIEQAFKRLMGNTKEAEVRRQRAKELAAAARRAVEEGGSSYGDVDRLIKQLATLNYRV